MGRQMVDLSCKSGLQCIQQVRKNAKERSDVVIFFCKIEVIPEYLKYCPLTDLVPCEFQFPGRPLPIIELFFSYDAGSQVSQTTNKKDGHGPASKRPD